MHAMGAAVLSLPVALGFVGADSPGCDDICRKALRAPLEEEWAPMTAGASAGNGVLAMATTQAVIHTSSFTFPAALDD